MKNIHGYETKNNKNFPNMTEKLEVTFFAHIFGVSCTLQLEFDETCRHICATLQHLGYC